MESDERDILDVLKMELDFLEKGGYHPSVHTPREIASVFQDSPTCLCYPTHAHDDECVLMKCVPCGEKGASIPCHHIPLNEAGETIETLEAKGDQEALEEAVKSWLRRRISQIEDQRAKTP
ncbi:MAG: hypothetical protein AB1631_01025 [Acidobacteriota bacterium]